MSDVPMHPQPPSHGDDPYGQQNPADPNGAPQDGAYGAHQEDQSWLLDDGPDPVLEPLPYEAVQALPEDLAEPAMEEENDWLASRAEEDLTGEPLAYEEAPVESAYAPEETYVHEEETLVGASYVEPEPKSRPFTRALMPGIAALLVSFGGIALWSSLKNPMGLESDVEMTQVESDRDGGPGGRRNVRLATPGGGDTSTTGTNGRMAVGEDGSVRSLAGKTAPSIGAEPTVDSPREPGELPEDVGPALPPQDVAAADPTDDDDFAGGTFDAADSTEPMGDDFDVATLEEAFGDLDDWTPPGDEPVAVAEADESVDAPEGPTVDEAFVADVDETVTDEPAVDETTTDETLVADAGETAGDEDESPDDWAEGDWTESEDEPLDDWAAWAAGSDEVASATGSDEVASATDVPTEDVVEDAAEADETVTPELDFEDFVTDSETVADATEPAEELDPLARALEQFENETVTVVAVEPEEVVEATPEATDAETTADEDETLASVTTEIPAEDVSTTFDIAPADEPDGLPVFGPDVETTAPADVATVAEPDFGPDFGPEETTPFDVADAEDVPADDTIADPTVDALDEVAVAADTPDAFRLEESEAHARLDEIFGDLGGEDFVVEAKPTTEEVTPEISDPFPPPPPGAGAEVDLGPPSGPESVADATDVEDATPGAETAGDAEGPVTDRVVMTPAGPDPVAESETVATDVVGPQPAPTDPTTEVAAADPLVPNTGGPVAPDAPQYPGADTKVGTDGQRFVEKDPVDVEVRSSLAGEGGPKKRGGVLTQVDEDAYWPHKSVPKRKFDNKSMVLTPNVGNVRVVFSGGESIDGRLHAVGQQRLVLDTKMGRMSVDSRRAERVDRISGVSATSLRPPSKTGSTSGLKRVRVRAKGGTFYGHLVAQDGNKVTLLLDEGFRITIESTDITEMGGKSGSRLRRMDDKK